MASSPGKSQKKQRRDEEEDEKSGLLALDDSMLLNILELSDNAASIVRVGAVNKRLRAVARRVSRINTAFNSPNDELLLLCLLESLDRDPRAYLRELNVRRRQVHHPQAHQAPNAPNQAPGLNWIGPVGNTLERLHLDDFEEPFPQLVARCNALVELELGNLTHRDADMVAAVVASCPRLETLSVGFVDGDLGGECDVQLSLVSPSLKKALLADGISATLDTPALNDLYISGFELKILSHSLRRLTLDQAVNFKFFPPDISPPLVNLEYLCFSDKIIPELVEEVLASISDGSLDVLRLEPYEAPIGESGTAPLSLVELLKPLRSLRSLRVYDLDFLEVVSSTSSNEEEESSSSILTRLGVETLVLDMQVYRRDVLWEMLPRIDNFLSCLPAEKVVMDWGFASRARQFQDIQETLQSRFPGITMVTR